MKFLVKLLVIGILGFAILAIGGRLALPSVARAGVEQGADSALGVHASLDDVVAGIGMGSTSLGLKGLVLDSPEGFAGAPLLEIGEATVDVGTFSLLSDTVRVPGITLRGLKLHLIQDGMKSNIKPVLDRIRELAQEKGKEPTDDSAGAPQPEPQTPDKTESDSNDESSKVLAFGNVSLSEIGFSLELKGIPGMQAQNFEWTAPAFDFDLSDKADRARVRTVGHLSARIIEELEARGMAAAEDILPATVLSILKGDTKIDGAVDELLDDGKGKLKQLQGELEADVKDDLKGIFGGK